MPDKRKSNPEQELVNVSASLSNIPPETPDHLLTDHLKNYADIKGTPPYIKKIPRWGRIFHRHSSISSNQNPPTYIPWQQSMLGRTIASIYDIQPVEIERQRQRRKQEQRERNRQQRQQRHREHYRNTKDSEPSQSEYD